MNVTVDSEETTCKLAKGTAAATDPANLPDRIPAEGILEAQQNYLTDNILAFCQAELPQEFSFMDTMCRILRITLSLLVAALHQ